MNLQKFTEKAQEAVVAAKQLAEDGQQQEIGIEHMLLALSDQKDGVVPRLLRLLGIEPAQFSSTMRRLIEAKPKVYGQSQVYIGGRLSTALTNAEREAERMKDDYVSTEH